MERRMKTAMKIAAAAALLATAACEKKHAPLRAAHIPHADTTAAPTHEYIINNYALGYAAWLTQEYFYC